MHKNTFIAAFTVGLLAVLWVGLGFVGNNPLALLMTALIAVVYTLGALELRQFRQATAALNAALHTPPASDNEFGPWFDRLPPALQNPVRLRLDGQRVGLPGPALTPYLVGLLVMLGMLGTFLGMVSTFNGAAFALDGSTHLQAVRSSLPLPIKGLGLAFGTSVAGVATSAMLGLLSALCRRERGQSAQLLDRKIGHELHPFSLAYQRQQTYQAIQAQSAALPGVVEKLQSLMESMERQQQQLGAQLLQQQEGFHREVKTAYAELAGSVDQTLKQSLSDSVRLAGESIKPVAEAALTGMAHEASRQHERMSQTVTAQLDTLAGRIDASAQQVAASWNAAVSQQQSSSERLLSGVEHSLSAFATSLEQRSSALLTQIGAAYQQLHHDQAASEQQRLSAWTGALEQVAGSLQQQWQQAGDHPLAQQQQLAATLAQTSADIRTQAGQGAEQLAAFTAGFAQQTTDLIARISDTHTRQQSEQAAGEQQRLAAWSQALDGIASSLRQEWQQAGAQTLAQQQQICATLDQTARRITEQAQANTEQTLGEITRLLHTAAEAPRAAAEVIAELRQELSASISRDNALLEERSRILATLNTLLDTIQQASAQQRQTIDALVASSEALLDRAGSQFTAQVETEAGRLTELSAQIGSSAVEVSALGESFNVAVQLFTEANDKLIDHLQKIEGALDQSQARSDEQLAYYVAQAREIIDLSLMSNKEVVEELRQLAPAAASEVA